MEICKECTRELEKLYARSMCRRCYSRIQGKVWKKNNPEKVKVLAKGYREKNKESIKKSSKILYEKKKEEGTLKKSTEWFRNNPEKAKASRDKYRSTRKEQIKAKRKAAQEANPEKHRLLRKAVRERQKLSPFHKVIQQLRNAFRKSYVLIKESKNGRKTFEELGFTKEQLLEKRDSYIGKPCVCGLLCSGQTIITIDNSHMDHMVPLAEVKTKEDAYYLNRLENLQWICAPCNLSKSNRLEAELVRPMVYTI